MCFNFVYLGSVYIDITKQGNLNEYLAQHHRASYSAPDGPGLSGNLLNFEGFYRENINIPIVRAERRCLAELQNDHKEIIEKLNRNIQVLHLLKFARDQPLKWYISSMACLTDPKLSKERIELTKPISFIYLIDDIFYVYGTLDELTLFTEAVNRWEITTIDHLPDYMKICFRALHDMTNEISCKVYQKHGWGPLHSLKKTWANLCNAFLVEAKWFASGHQPKAEEYLKNGIVSSGVNVVLVHIFFLLDQNITKLAPKSSSLKPSAGQSASVVNAGESTIEILRLRWI